ncbi:hypothetical protein Poly21_57130 [Allorhodopirellula heiligendammensis]|uniref:Uncharacterized protein n=2 Tax=Allorhodopirellula heiligendammensis TaxID=2714739 RepID=A0A5C6B4H0_9BACT|nr:hypothetical protein Poly21_57130 [Allorhodopirellula heiligendammensis]
MFLGLSTRPADGQRYLTETMAVHTPLLVSFVIATLCGCSGTVDRSIASYDLVGDVPRHWSLTVDAAIDTSTAYCSRNGIDLSRYQIPSVSCDTLDGDRFWAILYQGVTPMPGNYIMLLLNDDTLEIEYVAGE